LKNLPFNPILHGEGKAIDFNERKMLYFIKYNQMWNGPNGK